MRKLLHVFTALLIFSVSAFAQDACKQRVETHLRLIGDSWMQFPQIYQAYDSALAKYGFPDYVSTGDGTALISMTAETWWQFPLAHAALEAALSTDVNRSIDVVMISLGGNDVVFKAHAGDSLSVLDGPLYDAKLFMDSIFDLIHQKEPNAQIIWQCYDYPNFGDPCLDYSWDPYCNLWEGRGYPTAFMLNRLVTYMTNYMDSVVQASNKPYLHFLDLRGLMQWKFGQTTPLRYAPYGTYPPHSVPFPGGRLDYPTPYAAMGLGGIDTYHLGPQGFTYIADFYVRNYISNYLRRNRDTTLHSLGQTNDGWVTADGTTGNGTVLVGKQSNVDTKGIFTFNTSVIPAGKVVKKAALFFREKTVKNPFPLSEKFPQNFQLDIQRGSFGNNAVESSDYAATAGFADAACFAGSLRGNEYTLRADLVADALPYINKNGLTQFRLSTSDDNLINFYSGDTAELEGPYLDLYYDTVTVTSVINKKDAGNTLQLYPNPATTELTLQLDNEWLYKKAVLRLYNTAGSLITTTTYDKISGPELKVDISSLAYGAYFISLENTAGARSVGSFVRLKE